MRRLIVLTAEAGVSAVLFWVLFHRIDPAQLMERMGAASRQLLLLLPLLLPGLVLLSALRMRRVLAAFGRPLSLPAAIEVVWVGFFFGQVLLNNAAGDAARVWRLSRRGVGFEIGMKVVLADLFFGFSALLLLTVLALPVVLPRVADPSLRATLSALALVGLGGALTFLLARFLPLALRRLPFLGWFAALSETVGWILASPRRGLPIIAQALAFQCLVVAIIWLIAKDFALPVTLADCLLLVPPVMLLSLLPVSFAGWGVREGAMVAAFGLLGVPATQSMAVSLVYGMGFLLVSLPGGLIWLLIRRTEAAVPPLGRAAATIGEVVDS